MKGKKVLVVGLGLSGRAAAEFLLSHGAEVHAVDRNAATLTHVEVQALKEKGLVATLEEQVAAINEFDFVVVSPGVPTSHRLYQQAVDEGIEVLGEIELGCRSLKNPVLGVTGTNGKTTVTLLVNHVLNHAGKRAKALGNVGAPLTKELAGVAPGDIIVLELSSYQLETLWQPVLDAAVILNITPDHLDRYPDMQAYAKAKIDIARCMKPTAPLYIDEKSFHEFRDLIDEKVFKKMGRDSAGDHFLLGDKSYPLSDDCRGMAPHDLENTMAAYALCCKMGVSESEFFAALASFKKPAHRIEFICEKEGISYYDDSKGTNIDAVIRAVSAVKGKVLLIAGGVDKGSAYTPWIEAFDKKVKGIFAIGQAAKKMQTQLSAHIPVTICDSLDAAVAAAKQQAERGDVIMLSPGCSSFDMFRDYAHRGDEFKRIVRTLLS